LASVYQSPYQLGATAAQLALDRVKERDSPVRKIVLKTELRIRESVAPPPKTGAPAGRSLVKRSNAVTAQV
jgi:LacI family transcriptional regulator